MERLSRWHSSCAVQVLLTLLKLELTGEIDVSIATCVLQEISTYDVKITATDESGVESTLEINVKDPNAQEDSNSGSSTGDSSSSDEGSALPSVSMLATVSVALLGAALMRREEE